MRVLLSTDTIGGVWSYALELARAMAPLGVEFIFATMGRPLSSVQRQQVETLANVSVRESQYKLEWMPDCWSDVYAAGDWLIELERETRPDVVHLNGYAHGQWPFSSPKLVVAHSCVLSWWRAVRGEQAPPEWDHYRLEVSAGLRAADRIVAPTRAMLEALYEHGPLLNALTIYNGRDPNRYQATASKEPFILSAGRLWDDAKNIAALDKIAAQLPWRVEVAGENTPPDGSRIHARNNVHALGLQDETAMARLMERAAIYCLPARYEPFGLSILEAAMSGCALVLGDIPSLRELWEHAAIFVAPDDTDALANALHRLINDPSHRGEQARLARERAMRFPAATMAEGYLALYQELADRTRASIEFSVPEWELPTNSAAVDKILEQVWSFDNAHLA